MQVADFVGKDDVAIGISRLVQLNVLCSSAGACGQLGPAEAQADMTPAAWEGGWVDLIHPLLVHCTLKHFEPSCTVDIWLHLRDTSFQCSRKFGIPLLVFQTYIPQAWDLCGL